MLNADPRRALEKAVEEVLETMFFRSVDPEWDPDGSGDGSEKPPSIAARLSFEGEPPGWLAVEVSLDAARPMAADFLGREEESLDQAAIGEVVCELANMICGAALSRVEGDTTFRLSSPEIVASLAPVADLEAATMHTARIAPGRLRAILHMERAKCSAAAKSAS